MSPHTNQCPEVNASRGVAAQQHEQILAAFGQLKSVVEEQLAAIHDRLEHVAEVVREAVEEIGVLRDAIDDETEVLEWAARNDKQFFRLTSMPVDPAAPDFAQRLNALTAEDLPCEEETTKQGSLF